MDNSCFIFVTCLLLDVFLFVIFAMGNKLNNKMAMKKTITAKAKEPIRLRIKKLANGNLSIYLDIYRDNSSSKIRQA